VLPHHFITLFSPIVPSRGYCRQKKIKMMLTARPESRAADRTSGKNEKGGSCQQALHIKYNVHSKTKRTIVLRPPREVSPPNHILEDKPDNRPGDVVLSRCGRDVTRTGEDQGEVEVTHPGVGPLERREPVNDGQDGADEEEPDETVVDLSLGELTARADDTPDEARRAEHLR
jgi:hypothetical protein